ncbi:MAG: hypothetical protein L0J11_03790 [Micrococcaceae bacterium]|nr:hypothetical protein [Micrococcaceae bacterium]
MTTDQDRRDDTGHQPRVSHSTPRPCTEPFYAVGGLDPDFAPPLHTPSKPGRCARRGARGRRATTTR